MKKYLRLYRIFLQLNFSKLVTYKANFYSSTLTSLAWAGFSVLSILLLTGNNPVIFGWSQQELLILTGVYSIYIGLFHVLFSRNLEQIARIAHRGQLDGYLLKPVDVQFYLSCWTINYSSIPRVISAILFVVWFLNKSGIYLTIFSIFQFILLGLLGITFLYAFWFTIIAITIRYTQLFNLSDLMYHLTDSAKYPSEMYKEFQYYLTIFLLPLSFVITLPTKSLLQKLSIIDISVLIFLASVLFLLSRKIGKYILRYYTSASS